MNNYPPLPTEFHIRKLRIRSHMWKHLSRERQFNFIQSCMKDLIGWKRKWGLLSKKTR